MQIIPPPKERSLLMSKICAKNTKPEIVVRKLLHSHGFRFRLHQRNLPGRPDLVLPKYKIVIFVHGCFWHSHDCKKGKSKPKTNTEFWEKKFLMNEKRDEFVTQKLTEQGWKVITIWECQTKNLESLKKNLLNLLPKKEITAL